MSDKTAVLLAAGRGMRMGALTDGKTKALLEVGGRTLLSSMLEFLKNMQAFEKIVVVGGFHFEKLEVAVRSLDAEIEVVENRDFVLQNLVSFACGERVALAGGLFVANADYIFLDSTKERVRGELNATAVYCSDDLSGDDTDVMKVQKDEKGNLVSMSKALKEFQSIYTGMFYIAPEHRAAVQEILPEIWNEIGREKATVEYIFPKLMERNVPVRVADVGPANWYEFDTPEDLEKARKALAS